METELALAGVRATPIPFQLLTLLNLTGTMWPKNAEVDDCMAFDYIIVGCGTAGSVLANRLTEDEDITVLAIEAGGDPNIQALLPGLFVTQPRTKRDWNYRSIPDDYAALGTNNYTTITAGKMLGGSSSLNHFLTLRGVPEDFDSWANISGNESWKYKDVLPYFIKSERIKDEEILEFDGEFHGTKGPVGMTRELSKRSEKYLEAFKEMGNEIVPDLSGPVNLGYAQGLLTIADGVRQSTAYAYLTPIRKRKNLYVLKYTLATKIIFRGKTACGVETIDKYDNTMVYRARKEVILSAGTFNTPQLLMLSGIGRKQHLESLNIVVRADLPVGNNLQDHTVTSVVFKMEKSIEKPPIMPLTKVGFPILTGLVTLEPNKTVGDYQTYIALLPHDTPDILLICGVLFVYKNEICKKFKKDSFGRNTMYSLLVDLQPSSRGYVRLNSKDPTDPPRIATGYYRNKQDLVKVGKYLKNFVKIKNSTYFRSVKAQAVDLKLEACKNLKYGSQKFWECYALNTASSSYHFSCTCPMGSVVDGDLKVYGFKRLRVVDASVMPNLPRANPAAAVLMIAEKAADMIKEDAKTLKNYNRCCGCS